MKEKLIIRNFGPIKSVELELGKITVLIGEQAVGKSTIAKVLAICRYFSYIVDYRFDKEHPNQWFYSGLRYWDISDYLKEDSIIQYVNPDYSVEITNTKITETEKGTDFGSLYEQNINLIAKSPRFIILLEEFEEVKLLASKEKNEKERWSFLNSWSPNENFFRLNVKKVMDNPFFIPTERGLQSLFSLGRNLDNLSDSLLDQLSQMSKIVKGFNTEMPIKTLNLLYKNENGQGKTRKSTESEFYTLHNGASGFKSTIPIEISIYYYSKIDKRRRTFIIEEPELNLFPKAQKKLMEFFVESLNEYGHSFLLPTHSPYTLTSLENLMYAYKLGNIKDGTYKDQVSKIVEEKYWLNPDEVSVYYLNGEEAINILDKTEALINKDYIDSVSEITNKEFDSLLAIEVQYENSENDL
jgi:energy-coupling factor transporter ATP-binding protein EcfA2